VPDTGDRIYVKGRLTPGAGRENMRPTYVVPHPAAARGILGIDVAPHSTSFCLAPRSALAEAVNYFVTQIIFVRIAVLVPHVPVRRWRPTGKR
jgi:hypothetical protein